MALEGVLLIDKPKGPTSFDVIHKVRSLSGMKRVGHAGTLDPEASGLLIVCLGSYTKLCGYLSDCSKIYEAVIELGTSTTSDDAEGIIMAKNPTHHLDLVQIGAACRNFVGKISQIPPRYSAIRVKGQRAYKMARAQVDFELAPRDVEIFSIEIIDTALPHISLRVHCSKGTYIRALARDIGAMLQVGGHTQEIRRIRSGGFEISQGLALEELSQENIHLRCLKDSAALAGLETLQVSKDDYEHIRHGRKVSLSGNVERGVVIALFEDRPIAVLGNKADGLEILRVM